MLASVVTALTATRRRHCHRLWLPWRIASVTFACGIVPCAVAVPFLFGSQPLYWCESSNTDVAGTFFEPVFANGNRIATLCFITDPVRKFLGRRRFPDWLAGARLLRIPEFSEGQEQFYLMPLRAALRKSAPSSSSSTDHAELLEVVYQGLAAGVSVTEAEGSVLMGVSLGLTHGCLAVALDRAGKPWEAVRISGPEQDAFRYAARLDLALTVADSGDYASAMALLEDAGLHAPGQLEKARSLVLMAALTSQIVGESVGSLQALSLYNDAYQTWSAASAPVGPQDAELASWIKDQLVAAFEPYGTAYPQVARTLSLDQRAVRSAEAYRTQTETAKGFKSWPAAAATLDAVRKRFRKFMTSDTAETWFDAERERLARLDAKTLLNEAQQAAARGPEEARWFTETVSAAYGMGTADEKQRVGPALERSAEACGEPWRSRFRDYFEYVDLVSDSMRQGTEDTTAQLNLSRKAAERFGFRKTATIFKSMAGATNSKDTPAFALAEPPPAEAWWTREYLDWFVATTWSLLGRSQGVCDRASSNCEEVLMSMQRYLCYDGSERHRLFAPGIGVSLWMLLGQPRIDPWWDHAFYFGVGTHFAQWQSGLLRRMTVSAEQ